MQLGGGGELGEAKHVKVRGRTINGTNAGSSAQHTYTKRHFPVSARRIAIIPAA